jgi:hypothetical protein
MKQKISYGRQLGIWTTYDRVEPGKKVLWELDMGDMTDLLLYDKNVSMEQVEKDIESYNGASVAKLGWSLRVLSPDEVYITYLSG